MKTAALYARFSTALQSERSIDDQLTLCREYAGREGLDVVAEYDDRARTGGSTHGRDGLADLLADATAGRFRILVVEALDRLSRDMADLANLYKRLTHLGIEIRAVHEGTVNTVLVGLRGLIGQMYREDNANKIRRGQAGRAKDGLYTGGRTYGYAAVDGKLGERAIREEEAAIVRRIYAELAGGSSPRAIAAGLNADRIPSPRGGKWNASTINGSKARSSGILYNPIYGGQLVYNRTHFRLAPDSGKRVSRPTGDGERVTTARPDLAIVPPDLYARVAEILAGRTGVRPSQQQRPKRLLSGLLRCGACGAGMSSVGPTRSGRQRIRCSGAKERHDCPDGRPVYLEPIEAAVVAGLRQELRDPRAIAEFAKAYAEETTRLAADAIAERSSLERRLRVIDSESERIIDWMLAGTGSVDRLSARAKELEREERDLKTRLAKADPVPATIALHPGVMRHYEAQLAEIAAALDRNATAGDITGTTALREMIESVTVYADGHATGCEIEIAGRLSALIGPEALPQTLRNLRVELGGSGGGI